MDPQAYSSQNAPQYQDQYSYIDPIIQPRKSLENLLKYLDNNQNEGTEAPQVKVIDINKATEIPVNPNDKR